MRDLLPLFGIFAPEDVQSMQAELDAGNRVDETPAHRTKRALSIIKRRIAGFDADAMDFPDHFPTTDSDQGTDAH